ncbi:uncharacterized protein BT62DRAFT_1075678 [Guyanagaster necrorhizus]|uniref:Uncharacterized protein n=1 Tax=Guyanagaster necrorhizus TaxID=856835 RepID=A0A9P7VT48_9AGAR|nr:uncharacterized protein BT62DRAFT_1075678 [Guyanagaster necrorhizus MCA 3950]KAG7446938.1 hypothetical protein BT62DRAFT_1075678 [Guyanagaster necrorhizus MCA 3950]
MNARVLEDIVYDWASLYLTISCEALASLAIIVSVTPPRVYVDQHLLGRVDMQTFFRESPGLATILTETAKRQAVSATLLYESLLR